MGKQNAVIAPGRITWIDTVKGLLVLLVILGHITNAAMVKSYLSSFYMPAFFILSGFTMRPILKNSLRNFLLNRACTILGPYLLFSFGWIAFSLTKQFIRPSDFTLTSALISIVLPYSGRIGGSVYIYWFLPCMYLAQLALAFMLYLPGKQKIIGFAVWAGYGILGITIEHGSLFICAFMAALFIGIGYIAKISGGGGVPRFV